MTYKELFKGSGDILKRGGEVLYANERADVNAVDLSMLELRQQFALAAR